VGDGVAYLQQTDVQPKRKTVSSDAFSLGGSRYEWRDVALGEGLMFVLILPRRYSLASSEPKPAGAKVFKKDRLALFWMPEGKYGARVTVTWSLTEVQGNLQREAEQLKAAARSQEAPTHAGVQVQPEGTERGLKWWLRYVVVPLVGGGGVIAIFVALLERRPAHSPDAQARAAPTVDCTRASQASTRKTTITFVNESGRPVQLFWVDVDGVEQPYPVLERGAALGMSTFVNHSWCIRDRDTRVALHAAIATESPQTLIVR
jgi:hypothetical protein